MTTTTTAECRTTNKDYANASLPASSTATTNSSSVTSPDSLTPTKDVDTTTGPGIVSPDEKSTSLFDENVEWEDDLTDEYMEYFFQRLAELDEKLAENDRRLDAIAADQKEIRQLIEKSRT